MTREVIVTDGGEITQGQIDKLWRLWREKEREMTSVDAPDYSMLNRLRECRDALRVLSGKELDGREMDMFLAVSKLLHIAEEQQGQIYQLTETIARVEKEIARLEQQTAGPII